MSFLTHWALVLQERFKTYHGLSEYLYIFKSLGGMFYAGPAKPEFGYLVPKFEDGSWYHTHEDDALNSLIEMIEYRKTGK